MLKSIKTEEVLGPNDWLHIPKHIRICSPYTVVKGSSTGPTKKRKPKTDKKRTKEQRRAISNKYDMYKARRENGKLGKVILIKLIESGVTRKDIKEKYGISPNTLSAAERNGAVTKDGYHFVKTKQGRKPGRQLELWG